MKILLAPNAYKECLSATEAAEAMAAGVRDAIPEAECILSPIADGGDGTLDAMLAAAGGEKVICEVADPLGRLVQAPLGLLENSQGAVIEMAEASGLKLLKPGERNPMVTTTRGTGQLMLEAMRRRSDSIILGIGGSATVDGGSGMARALGYRFLSEEGKDLAEGGGSLRKLAAIDASGREPRLDQTKVMIASDVTNPLLGEDGAAKVYGPQKGATPEMVDKLEAALARLAEIIKRDLGVDVKDRPGAGAAGGLGAGLIAFAGASMHPGIDLVLEQTGFHEKIEQAGLVMTGEGAVDRQTAFGKGPAGVAKAATERNIPCYCLAGKVQEGAEETLRQVGFTIVCPVNPPDSSLEDSLREAATRIRDTARRMAEEYKKQHAGK